MNILRFKLFFKFLWKKEKMGTKNYKEYEDEYRT